MKRITIILFSLILTLPIAAQKKTLELGIWKSHTNLTHPVKVF